MISLYFGLPGCGKTTLLSSMAVKYISRGYTVYGNIDLAVKGYIRIDNECVGRYDLHNCIILIDEGTTKATLSFLPSSGTDLTSGSVSSLTACTMSTRVRLPACGSQGITVSRMALLSPTRRSRTARSSGRSCRDIASPGFCSASLAAGFTVRSITGTLTAGSALPFPRCRHVTSPGTAKKDSGTHGAPDRRAVRFFFGVRVCSGSSFFILMLCL